MQKPTIRSFSQAYSKLCTINLTQNSISISTSVNCNLQFCQVILVQTEKACCMYQPPYKNVINCRGLVHDVSAFRFSLFVFVGALVMFLVNG